MSFLVACNKSELSVDASTDDLLQSTVAEVRRELSPSELEKFDDALKMIGIGYGDFSYFFTEKTPELTKIKNKFKATVHGKTADQIIKKGDILKGDLEDLEKLQNIKEIAALEEKKAHSLASMEGLKLVQLVKSGIYKENNKTIIEIDVKNNTPKTIYRIYFKGVIKGENNKISIEGYFNEAITGGFKPKEEKHFRLMPRWKSRWNDVELDDTNFSIYVDRIDDFKGSDIFSISTFGEKEEKRLLELLAKNNKK